jgi:hypothetical protein
VSDLKGRELLYTYTNTENKTMKERAIYVLGLQSGAGILLTAPEELFDRHNEIFERMLETYRLELEDFQRQGRR